MFGIHSVNVDHCICVLSHCGMSYLCVSKILARGKINRVKFKRTMNKYTEKEI
jgi:hypothetical protein